jgi:hypothetical protein
MWRNGTGSSWFPGWGDCFYSHPSSSAGYKARGRNGPPCCSLQQQWSCLADWH